MQFIRNLYRPFLPPFLLFLCIVILNSSSVYAIENAILKSKQLIDTQGKYDEAIVILQKSLAHNPKNATAWYWLAIAHQKINDNQKSQTEMEKAFALGLTKPYHLTGYDYLGWVYYKNYKFDMAFETFNKALAINPGYFSSTKGRGLANNALANYENAIKDFDFCIRIAPNDMELYRIRGISFIILKNIKKLFLILTRHFQKIFRVLRKETFYI
mgnify:CR=1 FL=1